MATVENSYEWMEGPIHVDVAFLHPAYKSLCVAIDMELVVTRDTFMLIVLELEERGKFLRELIKFNDERSGLAFTSLMMWRMENMGRPLYWWESFGYSHRRLQRVRTKLLKLGM